MSKNDDSKIGLTEVPDIDRQDIEKAEKIDKKANIQKNDDDSVHIEIEADFDNPSEAISTLIHEIGQLKKLDEAI